MKKIIIFLLFASPVVFSQNAWILKPTSTSENISDVSYLGAGKWVACAEGGIILRSSDDGEHWQIITTPVTQHLWSISFANPQTGWAVGSDGQIIKTTNSGSVWFIQAAGTF